MSKITIKVTDTENTNKMDEAIAALLTAGFSEDSPAVVNLQKQAKEKAVTRVYTGDVEMTLDVIQSLEHLTGFLPLVKERETNTSNWTPAESDVIRSEWRAAGNNVSDRGPLPKDAIAYAIAEGFVTAKH